MAIIHLKEFPDYYQFIRIKELFGTGSERDICNFSSDPDNERPVTIPNIGYNYSYSKNIIIKVNKALESVIGRKITNFGLYFSPISSFTNNNLGCLVATEMKFTDQDWQAGLSSYVRPYDQCLSIRFKTDNMLRYSDKYPFRLGIHSESENTIISNILTIQEFCCHTSRQRTMEPTSLELILFTE